VTEFLTNPALWAAVAALLAALGVVEIEAPLWTHVAEAVAAIAAIIGIVFAVKDARE
jgi:predicted permease